MNRFIGVARDERGLALPMVLAVSILTFLLLTAVLSQLMRAGHAAAAEWKMIRAQHAAESGLARIQARLCSPSRDGSPLTTRMNGIRADTRMERREGETIRVISVARGKGVKQTVRADLDRRTCEVKEWGR